MALEVLVKLVRKLAADVLFWVILVSSKDENSGGVNLLIPPPFWSVPLRDALHVVRNSNVDVAKFDIPLLQRPVLFQFGPLRDKSCAVLALRVHECDNPEVIIVAHNHVVEV